MSDDNDHNHCLYWFSHGERCKNNINESELYCKRHKKNSNYIFEMKCMQSILCEEDIYKIFKYIYTNDCKINDDLIISEKDLFVKIIDYLLTREKLLSIIENIQIIKNTKKQILDQLYDIYYKRFVLEKNDKLSKIIKIQRWMRYNIYRIITRYNKEKSENTDDPFTFDSIDEIPENCKFSYKDSFGHIYIFNIIEFEYFIRHNGKWNPYTKEQLSDYIVNRVYMIIEYNKLKIKNDDIQWQTPQQAFTEVSQLMEKMGFYNDVVWFDKLTISICKNVIKVYRDLCRNIQDSQLYFPLGFEMSKKDYVYDFCKEVIKLFKEADDHYILCCNFVKALALNIEEFYKNIPSWLSNIDSPIDFIENDRIFYMYVQNLLENMTNNENDILNTNYMYYSYRI